MKVLYIGNYRDGTGWANACINNILAMDAAGIYVVPRAISFENSDSNYPDRIKELEKRSNKDCNICVQHTLPHLYSYNSDYKNIGFLAVESYNFIDTGWQRHINLMDELWVPSEETKQCAERSGVTVPIRIVPHSLDISKYDKPSGQLVEQMLNSYTFGFVGEFIERKNLKALIQAFHIEFDNTEPVSLFIKTSKVDITSLQSYCSQIKKGLKIRSSYKDEIVISGMMPREDYISVLNQINCFVMPSRGEAFCIPALEAMALGKPVLYTEGIGMSYCVGDPVSSHSVPCFGATDTIADLDTANTTWLEIDVLELGKKMRKMYELANTEDFQLSESNIAKACKEKASLYDHKNIGIKIKDILNDC